MFIQIKYFSFLILLFSFLSSQELLLPAIDRDDQIIKHKYYTLNYSEKHEQASWVTYILKDEYVIGATKRTNNFRPDPKVKTGSASLLDYRSAGYDRGHLAPAGDMKYSETAMSESFYLSNMSPQVAGFNRGIWKNLESLIRNWVQKDKELQVVTGGVLNGSFKTIGLNKVSVPDYFYKVILDYQEPDIKGIGFVIPNKKTKLGLSKYAMSIDEVEKITKIDFFESLPDEIENKIESNLNLEKFTFSKRGNQSYSKNIKSKVASLNEKVNINVSTKSELMKLPGIGDKLSNKIIEYRQKNGRFRSLNDLKKIKGIGEKTALKVKPYIVF